MGGPRESGVIRWPVAGLAVISPAMDWRGEVEISVAWSGAVAA